MSNAAQCMAHWEFTNQHIEGTSYSSAVNSKFTSSFVTIRYAPKSYILKEHITSEFLEIRPESSGLLLTAKTIGQMAETYPGDDGACALFAPTRPPRGVEDTIAPSLTLSLHLGGRDSPGTRALACSQAAASAPRAEGPHLRASEHLRTDGAGTGWEARGDAAAGSGQVRL